jgi:hemolysin III
MNDDVPVIERTIKKIREYSRREYWIDAVVHILGIVFAVNASAWLIAQVVVNYAGHLTELSVVVSVSIYCLGLLAMIGLSASYNLVWHEPSRAVLRRLDHAGIFIMIAATYTPFAANSLGGAAGTALLIAVWVLATAGIILKALFPRRFEVFGVGLYLVMGWMIVPLIRPLSESVATVDLWLLLGGGAVYSAGVIFYALHRIPFHKAIWHAFVLAAAIMHFIAVASEFAV